MKCRLIKNAIVNINGVDITIPQGAEVELPCESKEHASELIAITKLPIDLSERVGGQVVRYAFGKRVLTQAPLTEEVDEQEPKKTGKKKAAG